MFRDTAAALPISLVELGNDREVVFSASYQDRGVLVVVDRDDLIHALPLDEWQIDAQCALEGVSRVECGCSLHGGTLYTPVGCIAIDVPALSAWLESAAPGDYWQPHQLATV